VGCSLDLIAGRQPRAPAWMQKAGLEWSYRLAHEPRRLFRRYATDGLWVGGYLLPWILSQWMSQAGR
jgi:UDP-N-acetyl-D-mannosaminuronic acid transferase (WecB/TagA/CpsF family)